MNKFIKINKKNKLENTDESSLNEKYLKHDNLLDLDGLDLFLELNILKKIIGSENDKPIDILNYIKKSKFFFKCIYRTILTIPVSEYQLLQLKGVFQNLN